MKITIEIDNVHAPDLLRFLADIHPDQKLTSSPDEADVRRAPLPEPPSKWAERVVMESTNTGESKRGAEKARHLTTADLGLEQPDTADPLKVAMDDPVEDVASGIARAHIDAMVEQTDREMLPRLIPQPGKKYRTRNGHEFTCSGNASLNDYIEGSLPAGPFYYRQDGQPVAGLGPDWDCVEEITDPVAVEEDPTQRDLPMLDTFPMLPPLPEGKTRWVNRGNGFRERIPCGGRFVKWLSSNGRWMPAVEFSHQSIYHIEAV